MCIPRVVSWGRIWPVVIVAWIEQSSPSMTVGEKERGPDLFISKIGKGERGWGIG